MIELRHISKTFSGVKALRDVSLRIRAGECLGLVGENGAGKSTLMKVLSGVWPKGSFEGEILLDGKSIGFQDPKEATHAGIAIIHQELSLFEELSVAENIFMGDLPCRLGILDQAQLRSKAEAILKRLGFQMDVAEKIKFLSVGERQLVEIARAFRRPVRALIFDEPTSALSDKEIEHLFGLIHELKKQGVACVYISHKLPEIHEVCDRIAVLRDGETVAHLDDKPFTDEKIIEAMVGRAIESIFPPKRLPDASRPKLLEVQNLTFVDPPSGRKILDHISFDVFQGEILGVAGLMGSRRTELLLSLFGALQAQKTEGCVRLEGRELSLDSPQAAIHGGLGLVTEDRKVSGLVLEMDVRSNMTLPILRRLSRFLKIHSPSEKDLVDYYIKILRIKTPSAHFKVRHLSGGNQQKVIIGRWLSTKPKILLLDEPTRGIDVRAKAEIYFLMRQLVDQGLTLVLVSSELPEVVSLSDRVLVMREGRMAGIIEGSAITQKAIMEKAAA